MSAELRAAQQRFVGMDAKLLAFAYQWAEDNGYECGEGEAWRDPRWAKQLAEMGLGIPDSLHIDRLARDLMLRKDGQMAPADAYKPLGEFWESIGGTWGGRWGDYDHFSLAYGGRK